MKPIPWFGRWSKPAAFGLCRIALAYATHPTSIKTPALPRVPMLRWISLQGRWPLPSAGAHVERHNVPSLPWRSHDHGAVESSEQRAKYTKKPLSVALLSGSSHDCTAFTAFVRALRSNLSTGHLTEVR